jgi:hypothetical protein
VKTTLRAAVAGVIAVLLVTGCTAPHHNDSSPAPTQSPAPTASSREFAANPTTTSLIYANVTVRHPTSWRLVPSAGMSAGPVATLAYLTNQRTVTQCSTSTGPTVVAVQCGPPVIAMQPNGLYIAFTGNFLQPHAPTSYNRVVKDHLATVQSVDPSTVNCPTGTVGAMQMSIFLPMPGSIPEGSGQSLVMSACYTGPNTSSITHDISALFDSVTFA